MKKSFVRTIGIMTVLTLITSLFGPFGFTTGAAAAHTTKGGYFMGEAESLKPLTNFEVVTESGLSGGKGIKPSIDTSSAKYAATDPADVDLSFTADADGTYAIWLRTSVSSVNKKIAVSVNGGNYTQTLVAGTIVKEYQWVKVLTTSAVKAGDTTDIRLKVTYGYWSWDSFVITNTSDVPNGTSGKLAAPVATPAPAPTAQVSAAPSKSQIALVDGFGSIEAEKLSITANFEIKDDALASGGKAILPTIDNSTAKYAATDPADVDLSFEADKAGSYYVWMRTNVSTVNKKASLSVRNGGYNVVPMAGNEAQSYQWVKVLSIGSVKEKELVSVRMKASYGHWTLDKVLYTNKKYAIPVGEKGELSEDKTMAYLPSGVYPKPSVTPPAEHPRLYFRASDLPAIKANLEKPQNKAAYERYKINLATESDGKLPAPLSDTQNTYSTSLASQIQSWAFEYALNKDPKYADKAITAVINFMQTGQFNVGSDNTRQLGSAILLASEVYDWCYDRLTPENKTQIIELCESLATAMEIGWPPSKQGSVVGHGGEGQLMVYQMSFGIATYNERPDIYNYVAGRFLSEFIEPRDFWYASNTHYQGAHYGSARYIWEILSQWMFKRMSGADVFSKDQQYVLYERLYTRRPDGELMLNGDSNISGGYENLYMQAMFYTANYYKDPYLKKEMMRENPYLSNFPLNVYTITPVEFLVFNDPDLDGRPVSELPLTKYFGSPNGMMVARTGWGDGVDSPAVVAQMKIKELYSANHDHADSGHFQLYYKGILASDSGLYGSYGNEQDSNYNKRTVAHNTITVYDPEEKLQLGKTGGANDGGQRTDNSGEPNNFATWTNGTYNVAKVLAHEYGPDQQNPTYAYLKGDITKAYAETKMKEFLRSFLFVDLKDEGYPAAMIVFDKVESQKPEFKKSWLLHGLQEPTVNGNVTEFVNTQRGNNGKMTVQTLLPKADNTTIEKIGGDGKEFWVDGKNYEEPSAVSALKSGKPGEAITWRIEVSPKKAEKLDYFLNVITVSDADKNLAPPPTHLIEGADFTGVKILDRVALFAKDATPIDKQLAFTAPGSEENLQYLVAGLKEGTWTLTAGATQLDVIATKEGGLLTFTAPAGAVSLTYKNTNAQRTIAAPIRPTYEGIDIRIDSKYIYTDSPATIVNDRTLVPLRAIFEKLGAQISWDDATQTVTGTKGGKTVKLTVDSTTAYVDGKEVVLDVAPTLINNRTMVPVRFVSESMGATVNWDPFAQCVDIKSGGGSTSSASSSSSGNTFPPLMKVDNALTVFGAIQSGSEDGNPIDNCMDGNLLTRWAVSGVDAWGIFDLGEVKSLDKVMLAYHSGNTRKSIFSIALSEDGENYTTAIDKMTASGTTLDLEGYDLGGKKARYVKYLGHGNSSNSWNSITEIVFVEKK